jgi:hypothetical protein
MPRVHHNTPAAKLVEELIHNANVSGNRPLEQRMADLTVWFYKNVEHIPRDNLAARQVFLEKAMWTMVEIQAMLLERIRETTGSKGLFIPRGINVEGDVREFS